MARRLSITRIVCAIVAAGLIGVAAYLAYGSFRINRDFHEWMDARPVEIAVDLSRPETFTAPFHQTCGISHGEAFYLTVPKSPDGADCAELLQGLRGTITINDEQDKEMETLEISGEVYHVDNTEGLLMLVDFRPFPEGNYTLTLEVEEGAPALAGIEQTIHAEYQLCGMERIGAQIAGLFAFVFAIPGLIVGVSVVRGFAKYGLRATTNDE